MSRARAQYGETCDGIANAPLDRECPSPFRHLSESVCLSIVANAELTPTVAKWLMRADACLMYIAHLQRSSDRSEPNVAVEAMSVESPKRKRKESNQRALDFLGSAKLLDTCNPGQTLFLLEHNWTVARALKVSDQSRSPCSR